MKGMREIRNRIKAVKSTGQITHAMELVAASKMKKAQNTAEAGRAYATLLMDLTDSVIENVPAEKINSRLSQNSDKRLIIVFSTDKGLCGALNSNLFKSILEIKGDAEYIAVGNKAANFIARTGRKLSAKFSLPDHISFSQTRKIAEYAMRTAVSEGFSSIEVLYSIFINTLKQEPALVKIAPVDNLDWFIDRLRKSYKLDTETRPKEDRQICFEPSAEEILRELPAFYIRQAINFMALDAKASEHSARMVAMKGASENADSLVSTLTLEYNKARQNAITTEILELAKTSESDGI